MNTHSTPTLAAVPATPCSRLADYLESPPPYRKHCTRERLWLVLDAHGDSVLWSEQEIAVDAAVEALNHMAGISSENAGVLAHADEKTL